MDRNWADVTSKGRDKHFPIRLTSVATMNEGNK